jgi:hypothetical protein
MASVTDLTDELDSIHTLDDEHEDTRTEEMELSIPTIW